jgi:hypothetical protein
MAKITADLIPQGYSPIHEVIEMYKSKSDFVHDLEGYLQAGVVLSTPKFFLMGKPVDKDQEPLGQWHLPEDKCNAWFVKWASGRGCLKYMMETVKPLAHVMFSRIKGNNTSEYKVYDWNKFHQKINYGTKTTISRNQTS